MAANASQELIQKLLLAEKEADQIIQTAKKNRAEMLKKAKEAAEKELQDFRAQQDAKFDAEVAAKSQTDQAAELKLITEKEVGRVQQDFEENKDITVSYICGKVLNVPLRLTETQQQALKTGMET